MDQSNKPFTVGDWILSALIILYVIGLIIESPKYPIEKDIISGLIPLGMAVWLAKRRGWIGSSPAAHTPDPVDLLPANAPDPITYIVNPGKLDKWQPDRASGLIQAILKQANRSAIDFMVEATHEGIQFLVHFHVGYVSLEMMQATVQAFYPGSLVSVAPGQTVEYPLYRQYVIFARSQQYPFFETLRTAHDIHTGDPIAILTQAMDNLEAGERLSFTISWVGHLELEPKQVDELLTMSKLEAGQRTPRYYRGKNWGEELGEDLVRMWQDSKTRVARFNTGDERRHRAKLGQRLYNCALSVVFDTPKTERSSFLNVITTPIKNLSHPQQPLIEDGEQRQMLVRSDEVYWSQSPSTVIWDWQKNTYKEVAAKAQQHTFSLTADELAALWHLPHEEFTSVHLKRSSAIQVELPKPLIALEKGVVLGTNCYGQHEHPVHLPDGERTQHLMVIGKPGTGKSSLLHRMIHDDIAHGLGVCVIDPHGTLVRDILQNSIPKQREGDVVVLDFADENYPPPLNPLYHPEGLENDIATGMLMSILSKMYEEFANKEMADTMEMMLMTLAAEAQPTLLDATRVFDNLTYRDSLLAKLDDFTVSQAWERFDNQSGGKQEEMKRPVLWRLNPFTRNKRLRRISGHPQPLDLRQLMRDKRIILVSLAADEAKIPEEQRRVLGAVLVSQMQMAAMAGAIGQSPYILYVDEAEHFTTTALDKMLSEARKRNLGLVLANQYFKQLAGNTLSAVEGTVGTYIAFEVGEPDAKVLIPYLKPQFAVGDLVALGKYRAAVSLRYNGQRHAFTLETLPPPHPADVPARTMAQEREKRIRQQSVEKFTPMTYSDVEAWLKARYNPPKDEAQAEREQPAAEQTKTKGATDEFMEEPKSET